MLRAVKILLVMVTALAACKGGSEPAGQGKAIEGKPDTKAGTDPDDATTPVVTLASRVANEHAVYHFAPNRQMAHRLVDGDLVIDAGAPGFARYTRFGQPTRRWKLVQMQDDEPTADPRGGGLLDVPLTAEQATSARSLAMRIHAARKGAIEVKLGGKKVAGARVELAAGWNTVAVPFEGRWAEGENLVELEAGVRVHVRWLRVSHAEAAVAAALPDPLAQSGWDAAAGTLKVGEHAGLAWYVTVPEGAALVADVVGSCKVDVTARPGDGVAVHGTLSGEAARVDLGALAGQVVRLELVGADCAAGGSLADARITLPGAAATAPPDGKAPKYVVFWVMDATRADKIAAFTPGARPETPNFDKLAEDGAVFRQHYVGGNESQVSHTSMFTSLYPAVHTVRTAGTSQENWIPKKYPTIGEVMSGAGFYTIGVTANGFIGNWGGYSRGFDEFRNLMQEKHKVNAYLPGTDIVQEAVRRLGEHTGDGKPVFVFMGTVDSHSPWVGRPPWMDKYDPGPYDGPFQERGMSGPLGLIKGKMGCHKIPPDRDIQRLRAIYDSTVSYQDALIGDLRAALEKLGIADETMIVITADHGEEMFEDKRCGHGKSLRDSLARVPLMVNYPGRIPARLVAEGSEGIDILPTILDTVGVAAPEHFQGRSLRGLAAGDGAGWAEPSFASQYEYAFAMRIGRWKAWVDRHAVPVVRDMVADPDEHQDVAATRPIERRYLTDHLGLYLEYREEWQKATWGVVSNMTEVAAGELEKR
jgi:arylsulfatase A-like enzyme